MDIGYYISSRYFQEMGSDGADSIYLFQNSDRWRDLVNAAINLRVSYPYTSEAPKVGDTKPDEQKDANSDVALANNSLHTSTAYTASFSSTFLVLWQRRPTGVCFTLEITEYFTQKLSGLPTQNTVPATFTFSVLIFQLHM
jgi:hypothetical protein